MTTVSETITAEGILAGGTDPVPDEGTIAGQQADERGRADRGNQLHLPGFEGQSIDVVRVAFSGTVVLDRNDPDAITFFKALRFGKRADLQISGIVKQRSFRQADTSEGTDTITISSVKVDTVTVK